MVSIYPKLRPFLPLTNFLNVIILIVFMPVEDLICTRAKRS